MNIVIEKGKITRFFYSLLSESCHNITNRQGSNFFRPWASIKHAHKRKCSEDQLPAFRIILSTIGPSLQHFQLHVHVLFLQRTLPVFQTYRTYRYDLRRRDSPASSGDPGFRRRIISKYEVIILTWYTTICVFRGIAPQH